MPHGEEGAPGATSATLARGAGPAVETFSARNAQGELRTLHKKAATAHEDSLGGLRWSGGAADFETDDGSPVERIDESTYRIVTTGEVVRREEGKHGVTHHPEHQTPAIKVPPDSGGSSAA